MLENTYSKISRLSKKSFIRFNMAQAKDFSYLIGAIPIASEMISNTARGYFEI